jgi:hypothetical protein
MNRRSASFVRVEVRFDGRTVLFIRVFLVGCSGLPLGKLFCCVEVVYTWNHVNFEVMNN